ncbi:MAG: (2Fe-2S)-binding protein [Gemmataceae bacterium]|nr:(2Fe-2S)-binding protein [Gemmataceae bacterium]
MCRCLKITEDMVIEAIAAGAQTVQDLSRQLGAGDGCMACRRHLESFLIRHRQNSLELVAS